MASGHGVFVGIEASAASAVVTNEITKPVLIQLIKDAQLKEAQRKGAVRIKRRDGSEFEIAPTRSKASPLDVQGVDLGLTAEEIASAIRETHMREGR